MSKIADDGMRPSERQPDDDVIRERPCPTCGTSYRVSQAGLDAHVATCRG